MPREVNRIEDKEKIDNLAHRINNDEIFITNNPESMEMSFGFILGLMSQEFTEERWKEFSESIGTVYEEMDKAAPRSVNGKPMFFSANFIHKDDLDILFEKLEEYDVKHETVNNDTEENRF